MILPGYYDALRDLLATGNPNKVISRVGFGVSTAPEHQDDSTLLNAFIKPLSGWEMDPDNTRLLRFTYRLERNEAVGMAITEIGLFTADDTLVARKVRAPIDKTSDMAFGDTWEILV